MEKDRSCFEGDVNPYEDFQAALWNEPRDEADSSLAPSKKENPQDHWSRPVISWFSTLMSPFWNKPRAESLSTVGASSGANHQDEWDKRVISWFLTLTQAHALGPHRPIWNLNKIDFAMQNYKLLPMKQRPKIVCLQILSLADVKLLDTRVKPFLKLCQIESLALSCPPFLAGNKQLSGFFTRCLHEIPTIDTISFKTELPFPLLSAIPAQPNVVSNLKTIKLREKLVLSEQNISLLSSVFIRATRLECISFGHSPVLCDAAAKGEQEASFLSASFWHLFDECNHMKDLVICGVMCAFLNVPVHIAHFIEAHPKLENLICSPDCKNRIRNSEAQSLLYAAIRNHSCLNYVECPQEPDSSMVGLLSHIILDLQTSFPRLKYLHLGPFEICKTLHHGFHMALHSSANLVADENTIYSLMEDAFSSSNMAGLHVPDCHSQFFLSAVEHALLTPGCSVVHTSVTCTSSVDPNSFCSTLARYEKLEVLHAEYFSQPPLLLGSLKRIPSNLKKVSLGVDGSPVEWQGLTELLSKQQTVEVLIISQTLPEDENEPISSECASQFGKVLKDHSSLRELQGSDLLPWPIVCEMIRAIAMIPKLEAISIDPNPVDVFELNQDRICRFESLIRHYLPLAQPSLQSADFMSSFGEEYGLEDESIGIVSPLDLKILHKITSIMEFSYWNETGRYSQWTCRNRLLARASELTDNTESPSRVPQTSDRAGAFWVNVLERPKSDEGWFSVHLKRPSNKGIPLVLWPHALAKLGSNQNEGSPVFQVLSGMDCRHLITTGGGSKEEKRGRKRACLLEHDARQEKNQCKFW